MVKSLFLYSQKNRWLIVALIISIAVHFSVLLNVSLTVPKPKENKQSLTVTISSTTDSPSSTKSNPTAKTEVLPEQNSPIARNRPITETIHASEHQSAKLRQVTSKALLPSVDETPAQQNTATISTKQDASAPETNPESQPNTDLIIKSANKPTPPTYQYVELEFDMFNGQAKPIGKSTVTFTLDANGTYILAETAQFQDPLTSRLNAIWQKSNGIIGENGLIPGYYSSEDTSNLKNSFSASFAWVENFVNVQHTNQTDKLPLLEGTQDALSTNYHWMFNPYDSPTPVLAGTELIQRQFRLVAEETLSTNMGALKCLHLQTQENNEKLELWLALDYQLLPVKLLRVDYAGIIIEEKIITRIGLINRQ